MKIDLGDIDWTLLRDQKRALLCLADGQLPEGWYEDIEIESEGVGYDLLDGLIHIIERIQDEAAEELGEEVVFGSEYDPWKCTVCGEIVQGKMLEEHLYCHHPSARKWEYSSILKHYERLANLEEA